MNIDPREQRRFHFFDFLGGRLLDHYTDGGPSQAHHRNEHTKHEHDRRRTHRRRLRNKGRIQPRVES